MKKAIFSPCRQYRYTLWREWGALPLEMFHLEDPHFDYYPGRPDQYVQFICLNPSTATDTLDDPTVRRCIAFAKSWGFGAFCMTNLFAYRATEPSDMMRQKDPVGPDNQKHLIEVAAGAGLVICAWGGLPFAEDQAKKTLACLKSLGLVVHALKTTQSGAPSHPLYLRADLRPEKYRYI